MHVLHLLRAVWMADGHLSPRHAGADHLALVTEFEIPAVCMLGVIDDCRLSRSKKQGTAVWQGGNSP